MPYSFISTPVSVTGASATAPTHITSVQLPYAGKWDVTYAVRMTGTPGGAALYGQNGGKYGGSESAGTKGSGVDESSAVGRVTITTTGAQTLNLRGWGTYQATTVDSVRTFLNADLVVGQVGPAGPQGKPGNNGVAGATGANGPAGPTGATGSQGPVGATGPTGPAGAKGDAGIAGVKGDKGLTGDKGPAGAQGPVGNTGATGATGPAGPTGARGQTGADGRSVTVYVQQRAPINSDGVAGDIWYQY